MDEKSQKATIRFIPGTGALEVDVEANGKSLADLVKEVGATLTGHQFSINGQAANGTSRVKPGDQVRGAPAVKGA